MENFSKMIRNFLTFYSFITHKSMKGFISNKSILINIYSLDIKKATIFGKLNPKSSNSVSSLFLKSFLMLSLFLLKLNLGKNGQEIIIGIIMGSTKAWNVFSSMRKSNNWQSHDSGIRSSEAESLGESEKASENAKDDRRAHWFGNFNL